MKPVAFSCVVDNDPFLLAQCFIWLNCLTEIRKVSPEHIFVHHTDIKNADFLAWLESKGVNRIPIKPYDARSPHCNKLRQLETFESGEYDQIVLMDCDTAFVGPAPLPEGRPASAKIVDFANPSESLLTGIFNAAGLKEPDWTPVTFAQGADRSRTDRNNVNGGLYILEGSFIGKLAPLWRKWADWSLEHRGLFGTYGIHVDQVSFALALRELGVTVAPLGIEWNYPMHIANASLPDIMPQILHFHRQFTPHFRLMATGVAKPDAAVHALNQRIEGFINTRFLNSLFWDLRYRIDPSLGSGLGSRGDILAAKRQWIGYALAAFTGKSVVDIGCGDLEVARILPNRDYLGMDVSEQALELAKTKRPDWCFAHVSAGTPPEFSADAVMCLDVLIHQKERPEFDRLVQTLANGTRERLIVSGYETPPPPSNIIAFHRPLTEALRAAADFGEISIIGTYRDVSLVVADKRKARPLHPNDMAPADYNHASTFTPRPDLLRVLADISREAFGFYTKHFPRAIEYPWIAAKLETLATGGKILDLGAGLNPLPIYFARRGISVECVDQHPLVRIPPVDQSWNEWGFYDYSRNHALLRSHNVNAMTFRPPALLDAVYSVSVIEHMPRTTWEAILTCCRSWLAPKGRLLLTVDLIPGTNLLWNYAEGRVVEPPEVHGDIAAFNGHLTGIGFTILETFVQREVPQSRTDLLFVDCVLEG